MSDKQKLLELEKLKRIPTPEIELAPIEKWMKKELGVSRIVTGKGPGKKKGKGSVVTYRHLSFGTFTVHIIHGKKGHEKISRFDLRKHLLPPLCVIVEQLG